MAKSTLVALSVFVVAFAGCRDSGGATTSESPPEQAAASPASSSPSPAKPSTQTAPSTRPSAVASPTRAVRLDEHSGVTVGPMPYRVVEPPSAPPTAPMVWALHGRGDRAEAFARLAHMVDLPVRTLVLDPPLFYGPRNGKQWYDVKSTSKRAQVDARVAELAELAKAVQKRYPGSPKPALYGFSQGAVVSMHAVARHPELFRAAVALSGYLMEGPLGGPHTAGPPTLVVWGDKDTVIAPERSKAALKRLNELGLPAKGATFSGRHSVPKSALKMLREHLSAHVLSGP